jgi:hypothetical protein
MGPTIAILLALAWCIGLAASKPAWGQPTVTLDAGQGKHVGEFIVPVNKS